MAYLNSPFLGKFILHELTFVRPGIGLIKLISSLSLVCLNLRSVEMSSSSISPILLVHGGAGDISDSRVNAKLDGVKKAAFAGYEVLNKTGNVLDAIEAAIYIMEDDEVCNAGIGSVLNLEGEVEMEALITEGKHLNAGAVSLVRNIQHPIRLARLVMEKTPHTILGSEGANLFATEMGIERIPEYKLITQAAINALERFKLKQGNLKLTEIGGGKEERGETVGCVAVDSTGHVASGTSTGGMTGKYKGRIGDTPLPGSGGYSDDHIGAVSTTGYGESILKYNLAHRILSAMQNGMSAQEATETGCKGMTERVGETAGAVTVSNKGEVGVSFTSKRMAWAYVANGEIHYGIEHGQDLKEKLPLGSN